MGWGKGKRWLSLGFGQGSWKSLDLSMLKKLERISEEVKSWRRWFQVLGFCGAGRRSGRAIQKAVGALRLDLRKQARA